MLGPITIYGLPLAEGVKFGLLEGRASPVVDWYSACQRYVTTWVEVSKSCIKTIPSSRSERL